MPTGASQIFTEQVRQALAILGVGGATPKAFLSARMDDQNSNIAQNDHVEFDDVLEVDTSGDIALAVGAAQLGGIVTLAIGKTYLFMAGIRADFTASGGVVRLRFRHNNIATEFGSRLEALPVTGAGNAQSISVCHGILPVSGEVATVELRITGVANLSSFRGAGSSVGNSWLSVIEIG